MKFKHIYPAAFTLIATVISTVGYPQGTATTEADIFYVPTPQAVVEAMLDVAKVGQDDIVYDLGSGDGRIVIAAASQYGATGIGIEIDPQYIEQSQQNAIEKNVATKVTFIQGDLFEADFSEATVIALYLSHELNLRLRPRLLSELRPGTRIVSHEFAMGDWEPEQKLNVGGHEVFYWIVP